MNKNCCMLFPKLLCAKPTSDIDEQRHDEAERRPGKKQNNFVQQQAHEPVLLLGQEQLFPGLPSHCSARYRCLVHFSVEIV